MSRRRFMPIWITPVLLGAAAVQQPPSQPLPPDEDAKPAQTKSGAKPADSDLPPDEDVIKPPDDYSFNPLKSKKSVDAGDTYYKKGKYYAAVNRYLDATKWNEGNAEAWLKLGEAQEKRNQLKEARDAYQKYLQLTGNTRAAAEVRKKLDRLK